MHRGQRTGGHRRQESGGGETSRRCVGKDPKGAHLRASWHRDEQRLAWLAELEQLGQQPWERRELKASGRRTRSEREGQSREEYRDG